MTETDAGTKPIRVLRVDDHTVPRKGMRALLEREPGLEVVGETEDGEHAMHAAERLRPVLHPTIARLVLQELHRPAQGKPSAPGEALSEREVEVLRLLARGMSNQEIADTLVLSEATVRTHVSSILRKLQLDSRRRAAL
jgi:DNA-binding NarL/FixJ family response regulator